MRYVIAPIVAALLAIITPARALTYTCADVRSYQAEIEAMPRELRRAWIKTLRITKKQIRQARACLRSPS